MNLGRRIQCIALSDPRIISTGLSVLLLPRCIKQPFPLWSFATSQDSKPENWVQIPSYLGFYKPLLSLFTFSGFYLWSRATHSYLWGPKSTSYLKPGRIFDYLQLNPILHSCFKCRRITFSMKCFCFKEHLI